ncbi:DUF2252 domain-containing protein [Methylicorpusculum sp.]|uniref:DUF2252 domain-containing protein n=1 Tax=Methylicorpusculum sp. TaxID=2713644 RepID=UPI00271F6585|nr:DUF2252 domain-containing protein [Methylicorpusculum sp.]MDO8846359.1 DUF2252 domain-containing protein [Methylicorpusculum sp.]
MKKKEKSKHNVDAHSPSVEIAAPITIDRRSRADRKDEGKAIRLAVPLANHADWHAPANRRDPIDLLIETGAGRVPELLPIRYGRMMQSPFAFYRGAAAIMSADLAGLPSTGIRVQACGDCHLVNFGSFATPERRQVTAINDFDETLPAPWEFDIKRLAVSFVVAGRNNRFTAEEARGAAQACARSYRERMREFSKMGVLDTWYFSIDMDDIVERIEDETTKARAKKRFAKARDRNILSEDFPELVTFEGGTHRIRDNPPLIYHAQGEEASKMESRVREAFERYRATLAEDKRLLLDRYEYKDLAAKVVGVGSVGTRCAIILMMGGADEPLFLQVKEANASVLEPYVGKSSYPNHGQRVVMGQRLMQSSTDIFLGWTETDIGKHFYIRQMRDMKLKPLIELFSPATMAQYAEICGWALAGAHARSGDAAKIAGYLGKKEDFEIALADFSEAYADQNDKDHQALVHAVQQGRLEVYLER